MKLFVSVAALALAFAAPVMAEIPAAPAATTEATTMMSADECTAELAKCADEACKTALEAKGCKAPEAAK